MIEKLKCQECKERFIGCHDVCEHYLQWKKENDELREKIHNKKWMEGIGNIDKKRRR